MSIRPDGPQEGIQKEGTSPSGDVPLDGEKREASSLGRMLRGLGDLSKNLALFECGVTFSA
jgi:hypothetical protein